MHCHSCMQVAIALHCVPHTVLCVFQQTKACVQTLESHSQNVTAVAFHPELPIILTGSEDGQLSLVFSNFHV